MGTTLTGTTPQDTYDSLIKVTDNGPLSGTAKYLSDGLGNDSALALSTSAVGIRTSSPAAPLHINLSDTAGVSTLEAARFGMGQISNFGDGVYTSYFYNTSTEGARIGMDASIAGGNLYFSANGAERMRITSAGLVGIGTSSPPADTNLTVLGNFQSGFYRNVTSGDRGYLLNLGANTAGGTLTNAATIVGILESGDASGYLSLQTRSGGTLSTRLRVDADGLKFGADTAAANALDDYEEGTWTMGVSFGGGTTGMTFGLREGRYTKIGRQVTVSGYMNLTNKGGSTGVAKITGLPFTINAEVPSYATANMWYSNVSFANQFQAIGAINTTLVELYELTEAGAITGLNETNFADNSEVIISFTYFV